MSLLSIWYVISGILGVSLVALSGIFGILIIIIVFGLACSMVDRGPEDIKVLLSIVILGILITALTIFTNIKCTENYKIVSEEINNIVTYEGISNIYQNKSSNTYMNFMQGNNNNNALLKLNTNICQVHYTNDSNIKIIKNHKEYLSKYRYLAPLNLNEDPYYDIYLPEKYKK